MICKYCNGKCKKDGFQKNGKQRYKCKECHRRQQRKYIYHAYKPETNSGIVILTKESVGIRGTARILGISVNTVLSRIISIADTIQQPVISKNQVYEVDEIRTFLKRKKNVIWVVYALNRKTKEVVSFNIGSRTNQTLRVVLKTLSYSRAKRIYTDRLKNYRYLIDNKIHRTSLFGTNHIERHNLNLRTHLKRLSRRTICFSRSIVILSAILKIYFWG